MIRMGRGAPLLLLLSLACAPWDPPPTKGEGVHLAREPDGLLADPALQEMVEFGLARDAEALTSALDHPEPRIRARAAFALGSVQDSLAGPALVRLLRDPEPRVREDAAFALGQIPGNRFGTALFDALKSEWQAPVRHALLEAVGRHCDETAARRLRSVDVAGLEAEVTRAVARCALAGQGGEEGLSFLAERLRHPEPCVRYWAAYPFGRLPEVQLWSGHLRAVRQALDSQGGDEASAPHLLRALGLAGDPTDRDRLVWWVRHGSQWQARANAAGALGSLALEPSWEALLTALDDPSVHVRIQAAEALRAGAERSRGMSARVTDRIRAWVQTHPSDAATAAPLLEGFGIRGDADAVEEWIADVASSSSEDGAWLAGIRGAAALDGASGVALLDAVVAQAPARPSRRAAMALGRRREAAGEPPEESAPGDDPAVPPPYLEVDWEKLRELGAAPRLHLETSRGLITLRLVPEEAPLTVGAIVGLAQAGRYDGVPFHRVVPNFVAQGGDVSRGGVAGVAGFRLRSEFTRIPYERGVMGMASSGKDTETTQFFMTHSPQPHLNGGYTAFGWVESGRIVLDALRPEDRVLRAWSTPR